jgi:hypothetical protein
MEQQKLKELMLRIETLRSYMNELISKNDLQDPKILEISRQLDKLLSDYYNLIKDRC